jgi:excisionase family DNA binding protein
VRPHVVVDGALAEEANMQIEQKGTLSTETPKYLSRRGVAARFRVSPSTITRWANKGLLKSIRTPGGHFRYPESEVDRLVRVEETEPS